LTTSEQTALDSDLLCRATAGFGPESASASNQNPYERRITTTGGNRSSNTKLHRFST
jgi:hypothetical protein